MLPANNVQTEFVLKALQHVRHMCTSLSQGSHIAAGQRGATTAKNPLSGAQANIYEQRLSLKTVVMDLKHTCPNYSDRHSSGRCSFLAPWFHRHRQSTQSRGAPQERCSNKQTIAEYGGRGMSDLRC